jgi:Polyketide cyclase / dehydrase and lipid transport
LRLVIGSIVILSLIVLFLFALFPSTVSVTRMVQINSSEDKILNSISDLRTWKRWNEFVNSPVAKNNLQSKPDSAWADHLQVGGNEISLSSVDHDHVYTLWTRGNKMFTGQFIIDTKNGPPIVIWTMNFDVKWYPWEKLASMFYDKQLGPLMEKSLMQLRDELEKDR